MSVDLETAYHDLGFLVETACMRPFNEYRWRSRRARSHWYQQEGILDAMAGPLSSIASRGNCDYVYLDDERWPHVHDADDLDVHLKGWFAKLKESIIEFRARDKDEEVDFVFMLETVHELDEAISLAVTLERARLQSNATTAKGG